MTSQKKGNNVHVSCLKNHDKSELRMHKRVLSFMMKTCQYKTNILQFYIWKRKLTTTLETKLSAKKTLFEARYDIEGETLKKRHWTRSAKGYNPRNTINEFKKMDDD